MEQFSAHLETTVTPRATATSSRVPFFRVKRDSESLRALLAAVFFLSLGVAVPARSEVVTQNHPVSETLATPAPPARSPSAVYALETVRPSSTTGAELAHRRHRHRDFDFDSDFDGDPSFCCGSCLSCFFVFPFLFFCSSLVMGIAIYRHASRRGDPDASLWGLFAFFLNIFGVFIYLNARPKQ